MSTEFRTSPSGPEFNLTNTFGELASTTFAANATITSLQPETKLVMAVLTASGASGGGGRNSIIPASTGGATGGGGGARMIAWFPTVLLTLLGFPATPIDVVIGAQVTTVGTGTPAGTSANGGFGTAGNPSSISLGSNVLACVFGGSGGLSGVSSTNRPGGPGGGWLNTAFLGSTAGGAPSTPLGQGADFGGAPSPISATPDSSACTVYGGGFGGGTSTNVVNGGPGGNSAFGGAGGGAGASTLLAGTAGTGGNGGASGMRNDGVLSGSGPTGGSATFPGTDGTSRSGSLLRAGDGGSGGGSSGVDGVNAGNGGNGGIPGGGGGGGGAHSGGVNGKAGDGGQGARGELVWVELG